MNLSLRPRFALAAVLAATATAVPLAAQLPFLGCIAGTEQSFSATGSVQTYALLAGATVVSIVADGASGGANISLDRGGHGAHIAAQVPVAGLSMLKVVVGRAGGDASPADGPGGGGGSFVYDPGQGLLVAAGAGGAAGGQPGNAGIDANLTPNGANGGGVIVAHGGTDGSGGDGGQGDNPSRTGGGGGGGGGSLGPGHDGWGFFPGKGGHQISSPGDAAGGAGGGPGAGPGGFGGGGGGYVR